MPRISRPNLVRKLSELWETEYKRTPYLKSVSIDDEVKLRGIHKSKLEYSFPVTVLCGPNGTGKTTFLALSLLAFHGIDALTAPFGSKGYFDFKYFFGFSEKEKHQEGIKKTILENETCKEIIMKTYGLDDRDWEVLANELNVMNEAHDLFYKLGDNIGKKDYEIRDFICITVQEIKKEEFNDLRRAMLPSEEQQQAAA